MSYFPIPPNIEVDFSEEKLLGSLTFLNFPNNFQKRNYIKVSQKEIYIGIYLLEDQLWKLIQVKKCLFKEFLEIDRELLSISDCEMAVAIIKKENSFPIKCEKLPRPDSLRVDKASIAERASYDFSYKSLKTSYQGEYPVKMSKIEQGSFFSFDALKGIGSESEVSNFLLLMNLNSSPFKQSIKKVSIYDPQTKNILLNLDARENQISIHNLSVLQEPKYLNKIFFLSSNEGVFIPLMLSLDLKSNQLSLEHTHPPRELFRGEDRWKAIKIIKKKWVL